MTGYEIAISVVQFLTLLVLIGMLVLTRNDFRIRMRPYIGFEEIKLKETNRLDEIEFEVNVRNIGQIPAKNAKLYGKFIVAGEEDTAFECETKGSVFPSNDPVPMWMIGIKEVNKASIINGSKELKLIMTVDYYGSGKDKYWTSSQRTYDSSRNGWMKEEGSWK